MYQGGKKVGFNNENDQCGYFWMGSKLISCLLKAKDLGNKIVQLFM